MLYYYHKQPCEHNNFSKYWSIWMKLCMQAYIHKISDEFENQIYSIKFDGVIALCNTAIFSPLFVYNIEFQVTVKAHGPLKVVGNNV